MQEIIKRKNLENKHIISLKFQENYNVSGWFKKKNLAYCFYFIPEYNLYEDFYGRNLGDFDAIQLEDLIISQVTFKSN
jgi:hypothetical protein